MVLRGRCNTSYDLASLVRGMHSTFTHMAWRDGKTHSLEVASSATFHVLRKSCRIASFFTAVKFKILEASWVRIAPFWTLCFGGKFACIFAFQIDSQILDR